MAQEPSAADVVVIRPSPLTWAVTDMPGSAAPAVFFIVPENVPVKPVRSWMTSSASCVQVHPNT